MTDITTPVDGPFPIRVVRTESGADLDVSAFLVRAVFAELFSQAYEDPEGFTEEFADMYELLRSAQHGGPDSAARHEFDARMEKYLGAFGDGLIPVYGGQVGRLRDRLAEIAAPRPVPAQREAGAA
ncbi:hypothetical protein [Streptomyces sp. SCL15-4]|uniref:hypothetical protein n=1 Tax=Streptomyces sp. SCL15-4 TaxID=2967221 RepID=UPI002965D749|nr:hypothetical protein [Streptomyces sp. SCL15-4]